jgi:hypothetical protein
MKRLLLAACAALAVGMFGVGSNDATAQCGYGGGGYGGYGYGGGGYGIGSYRSPGLSIGIGYNSYPNYGYSSYRSAYRGGGHYDYHPTTVIPHGNHVHVNP